MLNNKSIHLGCFDNLEDAKKARRLKAIEFVGNFMNKKIINNYLKII